MIFKKPRKRTTEKRQTRTAHRDQVAEIRAYVFARERGICRCCRIRPAESMHELKPRSRGGKVSKENSIAVCGNGTAGCHGFLQRHEILVSPDRISWAQNTLSFHPKTSASVAWLHIVRADYEIQNAIDNF